MNDRRVQRNEVVHAISSTVYELQNDSVMTVVTADANSLDDVLIRRDSYQNFFASFLSSYRSLHRSKRRKRHHQSLHIESVYYILTFNYLID